jgi:hypothetical protein
MLLCRQFDLFGRELIAVDGTRIKAVSNKDRNFTHASLTQFINLANAKLDDYLQRLDQSDADKAKTTGSRVKNLAEKITAIREPPRRCQARLEQLERTGEGQISLADPDSRTMAAHTRVAVGYNAQVAVDAKHKLIVEHQVTNQVACGSPPITTAAMALGCVYAHLYVICDINPVSYPARVQVIDAEMAAINIAPFEFRGA